MRFSINPARDVGLRPEARIKTDMIRNELKSQGVEDVPEEVRKTIPLRPAPATSGYEILEDTMTTTSSDPLLDAARVS